MKNIAILSNPRSGSSWVGQIFNSSPEVLFKFQPNFAYSFPLSLSEDSSELEIKNFYRKLIESNDAFVNGEISISGKNNKKFDKSNYNTLVWKEVHNLYLAKTLLKNCNTKVIGIVRSPFSVISSWIKIPKEFDSSWNVSEQWRYASLKNQDSSNNFFGFEKWKEVASLFLSLKKEYPAQFYLLEYEKLLSNKSEEVKKMFEFCNLEFNSQTIDFLNESSSVNDEDAYSVFKTKKTDNLWEQELPQFIIDEIKKDVKFQFLNEIFKWI